MKFLWKDVTIKSVSARMKVYEYCAKFNNLLIDAAIVEVDGRVGPKINKTFAELLFVLSGKLIVLEENDKHILNKRDVFIIYPQIKHILHGEKCTLFVSCAPQFNGANVEFVN